MIFEQNKYELVAGLEVHAQLLTKSKIFCRCSTLFGAEPNTNVCPVCMGHPGVLPGLNESAVEFIVKMGMAVNCTINIKSYFARKNYFYPDLPKGYQISQFDLPFCENGYISLDEKVVRIKRIHLEEDAGKLIHSSGGSTAIDLNRCGVPLIEIVTEPDLRSPADAYKFLLKIRQILKYLEICDGNMEEGSLRCDANISVRPSGSRQLGVKTEIKNLNSFRNVERAIVYEFSRQVEIIESGGIIRQETLLWDADKNTSILMRSKEDAHDYRYFPEPDLLPVSLDEKFLQKIKSEIPELPDQKRERFLRDYNLPEYDTDILTSEKDIALYFESAAGYTKEKKSLSNWIMGDVLGYLNETGSEISTFPVSPENLAGLINLISSGEISSKIAKEIFPMMITERRHPAEIVKQSGLTQLSDKSELSTIIDSLINDYPKELQEYISGKEKVIVFFVGKVMKATSGKANPSVVNSILKEKLEYLKLNFNRRN